nr:RNA polymerase II degradation factor 1-like [Leptinotarsa decemlineata]
MEDKAETCQSDDKKTEESSQKPTADDNSEPAKVDLKLSPDQKNLRSRSRTPQKKVEESKMLQITLQKMDVEMNGKDLLEENEKTEEESAVNSEKLDTEDVVEEDADKIDSEKIEENGQSSSLSHDKTETESNKSANSTPKKRTSPRIEASLKNAENFKKPEDVEPEKDSVEMDPLVITDEPDPELQFDENSDMESGKGSPVIQRCVTRRSQTRNIPTPRTPKIPEQDQEMEKAESPTEEIEVQKEVLLETNIFNKTSDSTDVTDVSTKVQVGSDVTRLEYTQRNLSIPEDTTYLDITRERSLKETLR